MSDKEFKIEDYITENYTFTKDSIIEGELESTITCEFNEKNHVIDVLNSMLIFLIHIHFIPLLLHIYGRFRPCYIENIQYVYRKG